MSELKVVDISNFPEGEEPRIGVFVCYCGLNIAGTVEIADLVEFSKTQPNVVCVVENRYTCADPGQKEIKDAIEKYNLNRVVVAACSPKMHEPTFRKCVEEAGLNPFLFEQANIREMCSWCHPGNKPESTDKAKEIILMSLAKVRLLKPLTRFEFPVTNRALVIGGGIAGIYAALDMADMGYQVYLVERDESIGGHMAQLDKTFPTLDCSICIEGPKMVEAARNPNIEVIAFADVVNVDGFVGNFKVTIKKKPRYVKQKNCTGCGECADVCPVEYPNKWEMNLGTRKAISVPFPQAVPLVFSIDKEHCIECYKCVERCGSRRAIDFEMEEEMIDIEVGTITVATGFDVYEPYDDARYGYGVYPNVVTAMEAERLINAAGPTGGEVIRSSDGHHPHSVAILQCIGSRDINKFEYCSGFCCMYAIKEAILIKEHEPDTEIYIVYMDMRTNFKGFEEFYRRARELGITFLRGNALQILEDKNNDLIIKLEDTMLGETVDLRAEMVILSTAGMPTAGTDELARILHVTRGTDGFFLENHPKLKPIDAPVDGIYYAGACQGLKDIPYSVSQGSGTAGRAATILSKDKVQIEPIVAVVDPEKCKHATSNCKTCQNVCPYGSPTGADDQPITINPATCHGCGTCVADCPWDAIDQQHFTDEQIYAQIRAALAENPEEKIMGFLCNWCCYSGADLAGTSRFSYPTRIRVIRVMCSGRVDRDFVYEALRLGAGAVFVGACHLPTDCHYISGNVWMKKRMEALQKSLVKDGMTEERLRIAYVSAAEGLIYANIMKDMDKMITNLGIDKIREENEKLRPKFEKTLSRKGIIPVL
ncbi:MAG: hydrogenase iron-sulfur subunit [Eubacteriaceae bacterium]|nr:hydrogenase iron-sulfur subunit [Eubacteriaceae bacterium]